jgi:hypothetical protein
MPQFEEGDDIVYQNPIYGQGKGVIMAWDEKRGMYMILPKKNIGTQYLFCYPSELISTPF